jgi:Holliday junction resolvase RusA-like endonuclease
VEAVVVGPVLWYLSSRGLVPELDVAIAGKPVGKGRPKFARKGEFVATITPDDTVAWERRAELIFREAWGSKAPLPRNGVEIVVVVEAVHSRPQALLPGKRKRVPVGRLPCGRKPDIDNVTKIALDALVLARVLEDDVAVCAVAAEKSYAALDEGPCVRVRVFVSDRDPEVPLWSS